MSKRAITLEKENESLTLDASELKRQNERQLRAVEAMAVAI